jgi:O-antigen/teichoic acid export membrane protein
VNGKADDILPYKAAQGTLYLSVSTILTIVFGAALFIFIARFLPSLSDFGLISALQMLINAGVILAGLGLTNAATRFMSYYFGAEKQDIARDVSTVVFRIGLLSSITISFLTYIFASSIASLLFHGTEYTHLIQLASIDIFLLSMTSFLVSILYSLHEFKKIATISIYSWIIKTGVAFILLISGMGISGIVIGFIIGDTTSLLAFGYILRTTIFKTCRQKIMTTLFKYSFPLYGSSILHFFSVNVDYYLVLILSTLSIAGIYSIAVLMGTVLLMILTSLEQTLLPFFSHLYGKADIESLKNKSTVVSRYLFLIYLPVGFAAFASSPVIITGIFGERYIESIYPCMIIVVGITLTSIGTVFNNVLKSVGSTRIFFASNLCAVSVQLFISALTIPVIGAIGAALARTSAYAIMLIVPAYGLKQIAGLSYDRRALEIGLLGSVVVTLTVFAVNSILAKPYCLLVSLPVAFMSYLVMLRLTHAMNSKDFEIINNILSGKIKWPLMVITKIVLH